MKFPKLKTPFIIAAPMNGGINNPRFAAAVANAGGVGSFGFAYHTPEKIVTDLRETRKLTDGPINANFFVYGNVSTPSAPVMNAASLALQERLHLKPSDIKIPLEPYYSNTDELLEAIWQEKPNLLTFHFGLPKEEHIEKARQLGIRVGITATCLQEALVIQASGADFIIAQGIEAGGHRGTFNESTTANGNVYWLWHTMNPVQFLFVRVLLY